MRIRQKLSQMYRLTLLLIMAVALFGCGQKGPLTLPAAPKTAPQNQTLPATKTPVATDRHEQSVPHSSDRDAGNSTVNSVEENTAPHADSSADRTTGQPAQPTLVMQAAANTAQEG